MSIELNPVGVKCNLQCPYCYEEPLREAGNFSTGYDLALMKEGLLKEGYRFSLFGGEPLLMPLEDLDEIMRWGREQYGGSGIQTNGTLVTEAHVQLFLEHLVNVGVSMDGPGELNDSRWQGDLERTRAATLRSEWAIRRLCEVGLFPSLIFTLYRGNAVGGRLKRLLGWLEELESIGVTSARVHLLEVENEEVRAGMALTDNENVAALLELMRFEQQPGRTMKFDLFSDMAKLLLGRDETGGVACVWNACDPYTTRAVRGVDGLGNNVNCGRTNKDGVDWGKADAEGFERQLALHATPQADGGCSGCRFFFACKGQCPGTAIGGDWRNRTEQCQVWFRMFERVERDLSGSAPISSNPAALAAVEAAMLRGWERGVNLSVQGAAAVASGAPMPLRSNQQHGDHWDAPDGYEHADGPTVVHGDAGTTIMHGDAPHGDS